MALAKGRQFWVIVHRWAGLTIALFLTIAGFTGIFLAFNDELEGVFAHRLTYAAKPYEGAQLLDAATLIDRVTQSHKGMIINYFPLRYEENKAVSIFPQKLNPKTGAPEAYSDKWDQMFVNPYNGEVQGYRKYGDILAGMENLMPFVYQLHYSLALGNFGYWAFGIAALIWVIDSFVAFYLTFPLKLTKQKSMPPKWLQRLNSWLGKWKPAWKIRWASGAYKFNFDLHRAGGLWVFPLLLVFALSSVAFNLRSVYNPVMQVLGARDYMEEIPALKHPLYTPPVPYPEAIQTGIALARDAAKANNLSYKEATYFGYFPEKGVYSISFTSGADFTEHGGWSRINYDAQSGKILAQEYPQKQNGANTFTNWISALHMGMVFGLPYRIFVSLIGALVTALSVTGVIIWMKKRSARIKGREKARLKTMNI